ncbi:MAG: hypothetical protein ACJA2Y_001412 [Cycloclasticus pugetii]|jgi:hypothetical protein|uniref:hypothetical protein n=1 Tax=Cycloclasticus pugetii TaxID=34068 RepID=UPI0039E650C8
MKKISHPNQGHVIPDYYVDGINRVFEDEGNLVLTFDSITGIETHDTIIKNEVLRLIISKRSAMLLTKELGVLTHEFVKNTDTSVSETKKSDLNESIERLGVPFQLKE